MKISWNSLKVSIAGAKLSHLVQKDKIWDHGSMIEQVKTIFFQVQKAMNKRDTEGLKKYMTNAGYEKFKTEMDQLPDAGKLRTIKNSKIKEIAVVKVMPATDKHPDLFIAVIKGYGVYDIEDRNTYSAPVKHDDIIRQFSQRWSFVRQGDWWLLDQVK